MPLTGYEKEYLAAIHSISATLARIDSSLVKIHEELRDLANATHCQPTDQELKEIFEDSEADRVIDELKSQVIWEP